MIVPGLLPPDIALHVAHELSGLLPPPADDAPDSEHFRDQTAFLKVADLYQPA
jgi:hypothetical protein